MLKLQIKTFLLSIIVSFSVIFLFGGWGKEGSLFILAILGAPLTILVYVLNIFDKLQFTYLVVFILAILQYQIVSFIITKVRKKHYRALIGIVILLSMFLMGYLLFH
jgi:hypothetical protein